MKTALALLVALPLAAGCSSLNLERGIYEGAQQYNRASRAPDGMPAREPGPDFRAYRKHLDQPPVSQQSSSP